MSEEYTDFETTAATQNVSDYSRRELGTAYTIELATYAIAFVSGTISFVHLLIRCKRSNNKKDLAFALKFSLAVGDCLTLFVFAPGQYTWILNFWWPTIFGDVGCRAFKFLSLFGFHMSANMQVLIGFERLYHAATMSRLKRGQDPFRQYCYVAFAWLLAFICSVPQLFIFGVHHTSDGYPQCVTARAAVELRASELWMQIERLELEARLNKSVQVDYTRYQEEMARLVEDLALWEQIEKAYNYVHFAMLCIIPYFSLMALLFLTLTIFKRALTTGEFMNVRDTLKMRFCCWGSTMVDDNENSTFKPYRPEISMIFYSGLSHDSSSDALMGIQLTSPKPSSVVIPARDELSQDEGSCARNTKYRNRSVSLCANSAASTVSAAMNRDNSSAAAIASSTKSIRSISPSRKSSRSFSIFGREFVLRTEASSERTTPKQARLMSAGPDLHHYGSKRSKIRQSISNFQIASKRRSSAPPVSVNAPWFGTVNNAHKTVRRQAIYTLTANLVLWGPYTIVGIISLLFSDLVNENVLQFGRQFSYALLVLNTTFNLQL